MPVQPRRAQQANPTHLLPDIWGFDRLFVDADAEPGDGDVGLPFGATLLISGSPGAGKTTFALALVRSLMLMKKKGPAAVPGKQKGTPADTTADSPRSRDIAFFISSEVTEKRLKRTFHPLGWFPKPPAEDEASVSPKPDDRVLQNEYDLWNGKEASRLVVIAPYPEMDRPVPTAEEQVNQIFNRIAKHVAPTEGAAEDRHYFVIVDSISALLKGCLSPGDERRQTHEILHRLQTLFGESRLALTLLLAEQDNEPDPESRRALVEDYLAHIVFRLYHKPLPLGRRQRLLEVVKSQGINMVPGEHSWSIVSNRNYREVFRHSSMWKDVKARALSKANEPGENDADEDKSRWSTMAIFARPRLQVPVSDETADKGKGKKKIKPPQNVCTGTPGLDHLLSRKGEYWLRSDRSWGIANLIADEPGKPSLKQGSTTLLAGPVGTGKTTLCLQFLLHDALKALCKVRAADIEGARPATPWTAAAPDGKPTTLFVSLGADAEHTLDVVSQRMVKRMYEGLRDGAKRTDTIRNDGKPTCEELLRAWRPKAPPAEGSTVYGCDLKALRSTVMVLGFLQSQFDFNHLVAHLDWALRNNTLTRIAFDGLSEWLALHDRPSAAKMLETISVVVANHSRQAITGRRSTAAKPPTVLMTYELQSADDPLAPQALGMSADNIIAVKQVNLQDEIHKIIYCLKSGHDTQDQNVRELVFDKKTGIFEVRSGLDTFNGLLSGKFDQAEVLMELFRENHAEKCFNQWLVHRLDRLSNLRFKVLDFSRYEIGRTLEDTESQTLFPPADLKIANVDEWWLGSLERISEPNHDRPTPDESPLLNLRDMWMTEGDREKLGPSWQDFWIFELEKAGPHRLRKVPESLKKDRPLYAVPGHMDFGLFCINAKLIHERLAEDKYWKPRLCPEAWPAKTSMDPSLLKNLVAAWRERASVLMPMSWTKVIRLAGGTEWFESPRPSRTDDSRTLVDLMKSMLDASAARPGKIAAFAFDSGTRETCVSFFFELAWAFGASPAFLAGDPTATDKKACTRALTFLQFLVLEELMPHRATVNTTRHSFFSRHYYSTLQSVADLERWDQQGLHTDDEILASGEGLAASIVAGSAHPPPPPPPRYAAPSLVAFPWYPAAEEAAGMTRKARVGDAWEKLKALARRFQAFGLDRGVAKTIAARRRGAPDEGLLKSSPERLLMLLSSRAGEKIKPSARDNSEPRTLTPTLADLLQLLHGHALRVLLLYPDRRDALLQAWPGLAAFGTAATGTESDGANNNASQPVLTGFNCSGSWMYAVHRSTRSPSLASNILQEMASLDAAEERARRGAGIPARHDFFELRGDGDVPGMEYTTWNELLTSCLAFSRSRGDVLDGGIRPARVHQIIYDEILDALQRAYLRLPTYRACKPKPGQPPSKSFSGLIRKINGEGKAAIKDIMASARKEQ